MHHLCMFFCVFVSYFGFWGFSSHSRISHSYGDLTFTCKVVQKFWPVLSTDGSWVVNFSSSYHTYCDTGHTFIMVISEETCHSYMLLCVGQWSCHCLFLRLSRLGLEYPTFRERSNRLCHHCGHFFMFYTWN